MTKYPAKWLSLVAMLLLLQIFFSSCPGSDPVPDNLEIPDNPDNPVVVDPVKPNENDNNEKLKIDISQPEIDEITDT